jgi:hypothetical protein
MVGEKINFTARTVTGSNGAWAINTNALGTLTPGTWMIFVNALTSATASATGFNPAIGTLTTANTGIISDPIQGFTNGSTLNTGLVLPVCVYTTASSVSLYANVFSYGAAQNVAFSGCAVRIA